MRNAALTLRPREAPGMERGGGGGGGGRGAGAFLAGGMPGTRIPASLARGRVFFGVPFPNGPLALGMYLFTPLHSRFLEASGSLT